MRQITVYSQDSCGACHELVPLISNLARKKGIPVTIVDVDKCGKPCDSIKYVPLIKVDGRQVNDIEGFFRQLMS